MAYNILVVDDSSTVRNIIAKALRHSGVDLGEIHFAADGAEALDVLAERWIDVVFADLNMPGMSGTQLVERMGDSSLLESIPVVVVSTEGRQERIDTLLDKGAAAFLRKPFSPEQVGEVVRQILGDDREVVPIVPVDEVDEAFFRAIEGFAMLVAEPASASETTFEGAVVAQMSFEGLKVTGRVQIAVSEDAAVAIGEAAVGDAVDVAQGEDAVGELLNVFLGQLTDRLHGGPFRFDPPTVEILDADAAWLILRGADVLRAYDVEGAPVLAALTVEPRW